MRKITQYFGAEYRAVDVGDMVNVPCDSPLRLDCGMVLSEIPIAYQAYGVLSAAKDNAILICHALTGDQYVSGTHPVTGKAGWWSEMVGAGKVIDTDRYYVLCINVIGGCMGGFGPKSIDPKTQAPYGVDFPVVTIGDMVEAQARLVAHLGIEKLFAVIGGSMGGMQALTWAARFPEKMMTCIPMATAARHSAQNIAFHEIGRQAIMADPDWHGGRYYSENSYPVKGLSVARMTAHITYMSESSLEEKFGRNLQDKERVTYGFDADFQVESYLRHQGASFVERFDPNSYLYITRAMDYFDLAAEYGGVLSAAFANSPIRFCVISFSSDWCYSTEESRHIVRSLNAAAANVSFTEIATDRGHDAFLLDDPVLSQTLSGFLEGAWKAWKNDGARA